MITKQTEQKACSHVSCHNWQDKWKETFYSAYFTVTGMEDGAYYIDVLDEIGGLLLKALFSLLKALQL